MVLEKCWEHFLVLQVKRNVRGQQHISFIWFLEFMFNDILLKNRSTETTWPQNLILVNAAWPCQTMMGDSWGRMHVSMACCILDVQGISLPYNGHVGHSLLWAFSNHSRWACCGFDCSGHFPLHCNGHVGHSLFWASFLFIQTSMLRFGCSGHLFLCIQMGTLRFGRSGHFFPS